MVLTPFVIHCEKSTIKKKIVSPCLGGVCIKLLLAQNKKEFVTSHKLQTNPLLENLKRQHEMQVLNLFNHAQGSKVTLQTAWLFTNRLWQVISLNTPPLF